MWLLWHQYWLGKTKPPWPLGNKPLQVGIGNLAFDPVRYAVVDYTTMLYVLQTAYITPKPKKTPVRATHKLYPTNNKLLIKFRLSSDAEIFVNKCQLCKQVGAEPAKTCMQCVRYKFRLSLHFAHQCWWLGKHSGIFNIRMHLSQKQKATDLLSLNPCQSSPLAELPEHLPAVHQAGLERRHGQLRPVQSRPPLRREVRELKRRL